MRGLLPLRTALLSLALAGLTALAQNPPPTPTAQPTPPAQAAPTPVPTGPAATVNGETIPEHAVQRALDRIPAARRSEERPKLVNYLIDNLLIDQSLRAAGWKVEAAEVDKSINDMKAELKKVNKDFDKMLAEMKVTEAELRHHIGADLRWFKYVSAQATDQALQELFNKNKDMFDGTAVKARHILISTPGKDAAGQSVAVTQLQQIKKAIEAEVAAGLAKLPSNTDKLTVEKTRGTLLVEAFSKAAREKSECPTKNQGGDVGWFQKVGFIVLPFSEAAFALQPYQMSEPVQTPFGYHLILVTDRKPGKEVKFEEVKEVVREVYFDRIREGLIEQLRARAKIEIHPVK